MIDYSMLLLLYAVSVLNSINGVVGALSVVIPVGYVSALLFYFMASDLQFDWLKLPRIKPFMIAWICCITLFVISPPKEDSYLILGGAAASKAITSEHATRMFNLFMDKTEEFLEKKDTKVKREET